MTGSLLLDHVARSDETASFGTAKFVTDSYCPGPKVRPPTCSTKFECRNNIQFPDRTTNDEIRSLRVLSSALLRFASSPKMWRCLPLKSLCSKMIMCSSRCAIFECSFLLTSFRTHVRYDMRAARNSQKPIRAHLDSHRMAHLSG